jgi:hypothetical protein
MTLDNKFDLKNNTQPTYYKTSTKKDASEEYLMV